MSDRWFHVKRIVQAALERPDAERNRFLDNACGSDAELRAEVESLLTTGSDSFTTPELADVTSLLTAGTRIGSYVVAERVGAGGMGEVYRARDLTLGRDVAIKVLPREMASKSERLRRFEQEARTASALNHPNIVTIYEVGEHEGAPYIAMEYVEGVTLREMLAAGALPNDKLVRYATQMAEGLAKAHKAGIVHRDLKPENIIISDDGYAIILDFGLAKLLPAGVVGAEVSTLAKDTTPGMILGTVGYMAPEQAKGQTADFRSDQFSLGTIVYEMATGKRAFERESATQTLASIIEDEPEPIGVVNPEVPAQLVDIVERCLSKAPQKRYGSTRDVVQAFEGESVRRAATKVVMASSSRALVYFGILAVVAIVVLFVLKTPLFVSNQETVPPSGETIHVVQSTQITRSLGLDTFPALSPDGNALAYTSNRSGRFEIYVRQLTAGGGEIQLTSDGKQNIQPAWSSDGQRIAYSRPGGGIWVVPALGGVGRQLTDFGSRPAWSPDGESVAFQSSVTVDFGISAYPSMPPSTIWIAPAGGGEPKRVTAPGEPLGGHGAPAWLLGGERIVFISSDIAFSAVWSVPLEGGEPTLLLGGRVDYVDDADRHYELLCSQRDNRLFFTAQLDHQFALWTVVLDANDGLPIGEPIQLANSTPSVIRHPTISADGSQIAYTSLSMTSSLTSIHFSPLSNELASDPHFLTRDTSERNNAPSFSPDGSTIAFRRMLSGTGSDIWLIGADGENPRQLTGDEAGVSQPHWVAPDGDRIIFERGGDRSGLWSVSVQGGREELVHTTEPDWGFWTLSPDGEQVVFASDRSGTSNLWIASLGDDHARQLTFDEEMMAFPSWSPDGELIAFQMKREPDVHIGILPPEGGTPIQLTRDPGLSFVYQGWSPDGDKIAFSGLRDGYWNIWWISRTTMEEQRLTDYADPSIFVRYPAWSPRGDQIVYEYAETRGNIWLSEISRPPTN